MVEFIDIEVIDLNEHLTERFEKPRGEWRFCFRLSQYVPEDWKQLFNKSYYKRCLMGPIA